MFVWKCNFLTLWTCIPLTFALSVPKYVTNSVTVRPITFLHETNNHGCTEISHRCSCSTLIVSTQWAFLEHTTPHRIIRRTKAFKTFRIGKKHSTIPRNLQNAKTILSKQNLIKNIKISNAKADSVSSSNLLSATSNMKNSSQKTWQTSLLFWHLFKWKPKEKKIKGHRILYLLPVWKSGDTSLLKKWRTRCPCPGP